MKQLILSAILFTGCACSTYAQGDATAIQPEKKEKKFDQYLGVQVNDLIRQVFNFNNTTVNANTNPFLAVYHINSIKTGWGLRAGIGYNYNSTSNNSGAVSTTSDINDVQFRLGLEKAFSLSDNWTAGAGLDFVYNSNDDKSTNITNSFDTVTTSTKTKVTSYGGGPMAWLRYNITKKILIGTEASFYYMTGKQSIDVHVEESGPGIVVQPTDSNTDNKIKSGTFSSPVVFYLLVKF